MAKKLQAISMWTIWLVAMLVVSLLLDGADGSRGSGRRRRRNKRGNAKCLASSIAEYKLTFYGAWSPDKFPRMYPRYRPPAQWSKLVGRSHGPAYNMWKLGQEADPALKVFAESGDSVLYDSQPQGYHGVFDSFYAEPITRGEGRTSTFIMADGVHSRVSFVVKLVPSPDWFVGVDNLELCRRGRWRARAHANLRPLDAGTDRGYTFTSPNWPSVPREPIYQIMSSYPDHPASAFLYPEYSRLPRMAYVHFQRVAQYVLKGPVSPLKGNHTNNLQIFGKKPAPIAVAATTTTTSITTTILNAAQIIYNSTERTKHLTQTTAAIAPIKGFAKSIDGASSSDLEHKPGYSAIYSLFHKQLEHQHVPVTAEAPTTTSVNFIKPSAPTESLKTLSSGGIVQIEREDEKKSPDAGSSLGVYHHDDTKTKKLQLDRLPVFQEIDSADALSENSRGSAAMREAINEVNETAKQDDRVPLFQAAVHREYSLDKNDLSTTKSSSVMQPSSMQLSPNNTMSTEATTGLYDEQDSLFIEKDAVLVSPASSRTLAKSFSSEIHPKSRAVRGQSLHSSQTSDLTSTVNGKETQEIRSSETPSELPLLKASETSTPAVMAVDKAKNSEHLTSPRLMKLQATEANIVKRPSKIRPGSYTRFRLGERPSKPQNKETPTYPESQSQKTLDEPQLPQNSVDDLTANNQPMDCHVKEWSDWSACSKTCGFGVRTRSRDVLQHSKNGGLSCPVLEQEMLCGSMRNCQWQHFSFLSSRKRTRRLRRRRHHHQRHHQTLRQRPRRRDH